MDTDPNPFRYNPDEDRSASPTEAPADDTEDFTIEDDTAQTTQTGDTPTQSPPPSPDTPSGQPVEPT